MDILDLDPSNFPRDPFGPPLGGMPFEDYERWLAEMTRAFADQIEKNPPPLHHGEPFVWIDHGGHPKIS